MNRDPVPFQLRLHRERLHLNFSLSVHSLRDLVKQHIRLQSSYVQQTIHRHAMQWWHPALRTDTLRLICFIWEGVVIHLNPVLCTTWLDLLYNSVHSVTIIVGRVKFFIFNPNFSCPVIRGKVWLKCNPPYRRVDEILRRDILANKYRESTNLIKGHLTPNQTSISSKYN